MKKTLLGILALSFQTLFSQTLVWKDSMTFESYKKLITPVTPKNKSYKLVVKGQMSLNNINMEKDPAFMFYYGIHNDVCWFWNGIKKLPTINQYNPNHEYFYNFNGNDSYQYFSFHDYPYSDNSGKFIFELYDITEPKSIIAIYTLTGKKIDKPVYNEVLIYVYSNKNIEKIIITQ